MKKRCPICGAEFECLHDTNIAACHCASVPLTAKDLQYLKKQYTGCLCHDCLLVVASRKACEQMHAQ